MGTSDILKNISNMKNNIKEIDNKDINNILLLDDDSNNNILDNILTIDKDDMKNKTFYMKVSILNQIEKYAKEKNISESKLVNEILSKVFGE